MGREASRTRIETRAVELRGRLVDAQAPAHWTGARLDAWIDWADGATDLPGAIADRVEDLTLSAQAKGLVKDVAARTRFRDQLTEALLAGVIALGSTPTADAIPVVERAADIAQVVAVYRGQAAAGAAALEFGRRMQAVMDAVLRCEGDAEACADPQTNPSLARAAEAARAAGAPDSLIFDAVNLARAGGETWAFEAPPEADTGLRLVVAGAPDEVVAGAAWATGAVTLAPSLALAERIAAGERAWRGGVDLMGFWSADGFDIDGFEAAVALLAGALAAASDEPGVIGLAGLGDWLVAHGLDYDSDAGRETARALYLAAQGAVAGSGAVWPCSVIRSWSCVWVADGFPASLGLAL